MMLNDGWTEGMTAAEVDAARDEMLRDAHPCCLECEKPGCVAIDCPSSLCDEPGLVICHGELVHAGCVAAFEARIANAEVA